jgi:hypothetical protein
VSLTRATLRFAELGFLGGTVNTCMTIPFRWGLLSRRGDLDKAFFCGRLQRIAWLSVLRVGAEVWKVLLTANLGDVEQHSWKAKGARGKAGRAKTLRSENMTAQYSCSIVCWLKLERVVGIVGCRVGENTGVCRFATRCFERM